MSVCAGGNECPKLQFLKLLRRSLLFASCNHGLVVNFGNIRTEQKWFVSNLERDMRANNQLGG